MNNKRLNVRRKAFLLVTSALHTNVHWFSKPLVVNLSGFVASLQWPLKFVPPLLINVNMYIVDCKTLLPHSCVCSSFHNFMPLILHSKHKNVRNLCPALLRLPNYYTITHQCSSGCDLMMGSSPTHKIGHSPAHLISEPNPMKTWAQIISMSILYSRGGQTAVL